MCQLLRAKYKKAGPTVPASQILKSKGGGGGWSGINHTHMQRLKHDKYKNIPPTQHTLLYNT